MFVLRTHRQKLRDYAFAAALVLLAAALQSGAVALRTQEHFAEPILRLHVVANSDSPGDQAVKLAVRDRVLAQTEALLEGQSDRTGAEAVLRRHLSEIRRCAGEILAAEGFSYGATAELGTEEFPTRSYESFSLPAGEYMALRVVLGDGQGKNWWCVVFPPLCTGGASLEDAGFSPRQIRLLTKDSPRYVIKFRTIELWETLRQKLS